MRTGIVTITEKELSREEHQLLVDALRSVGKGGRGERTDRRGELKGWRKGKEKKERSEGKEKGRPDILKLLL